MASRSVRLNARSHAKCNSFWCLSYLIFRCSVVFVNWMLNEDNTSAKMLKDFVLASQNLNQSDKHAKALRWRRYVWRGGKKQMLVSQILKRKMAKSCIGSDDIVILMARKIIPNNFVIAWNATISQQKKWNNITTMSILLGNILLLLLLLWILENFCEIHSEIYLIVAVDSHMRWRLAAWHALLLACCSPLTQTCTIEPHVLWHDDAIRCSYFHPPKTYNSRETKRTHSKLGIEKQ